MPVKEIKMGSKLNKYYRIAYNNPKQFSNINLNIESEVTKQIVAGVTDAAKDKQNGTYKFIT